MKKKCSQSNYNKIKSNICIGRENRLNFTYSGLNIKSNFKTITFDLYHYIQNLQKINIPTNKKQSIQSVH